MASPAHPHRLLLVALVGLLGLVTFGALFIEPLIAPIPVVAVGVLYLIWRAPLRYLAFTLYFLTLSVDMITENPYQQMWKTSPLFFPGRLLFEQLNSLTGVGALRFPLVDLLVVGMLGIYGFRRATRAQVDPPVLPMPRPLALALVLSPMTIIWMEVYGIVRGGNLQNSLWQWHQLAVLPLVVALFNVTVRGPEDHPILMKIVVAGGFIKAVMGAFFIVFIAHPAGKDPEYATCHSDSLTYVMSLVLAVTPWLEKQTVKRFLWMGFIWGWIIIGMYFNDRRLAYVSLGGSLFAVFLISPWTRLKRFLTRSAAVMAPIVALYIAAGWNSESGIFKPVHTIKTLVEGEHFGGELDYRDIENWDVISTWKQNPILGFGYGHEFVEPIKLPDISFVFPQYRYHPHNSLMGMFAWGGTVGFSGITMYIVITVFLTARAYHRAHSPDWRAACLVIISYVACYANQCFGDMGTISWISVFHMGAAVACASKLSILTGAWPDPRRAKARRPAIQTITMTAPPSR